MNQIAFRKLTFCAAALILVSGLGISPISCGDKQASSPSNSVSPAVVCTVPDSGTSKTFDYTGSVQTFTVPSGVTQITVSASGGAGGNGDFSGTTGGAGASINSPLFSVTPSDVLQIVVGGQGSDGQGGGGGGTAVRNSTTGTLLVLMGGGGGAAAGVSCAAARPVISGCPASTSASPNDCGVANSGGSCSAHFTDGTNSTLSGSGPGAAGEGGTSCATCGPGSGGGSYSTPGTSAGATTWLAGGGGGGLGAAGGTAPGGGVAGAWGGGGGGAGGYESGGGGGGYEGGGGGSDLTGSVGAPGGGGGSYCNASAVVNGSSCGAISATNNNDGSGDNGNAFVTIDY